MVMEVVQEDTGEDTMYCTKHPYKNNTPGGICAFCLEEKLGKLVSSSFPVAIFPSTSSSPSSSFRSDSGGTSLTTTKTTTTFTTTNATTSSALALNSTVSNKNTQQYYNSRSSKFPFLLTQRRKKKKDGVMGVSDSVSNMVFQRSKSTIIPRNRMHFGDAEEEDNPNKKGFWSFLYSSSSKHLNSSKKHDRTFKDSAFASSSSSSSTAAGGTVTAPPSAVNMSNGALKAKQKQREEFIVLEENNLSPDQASFDSKVSRSRSVGCGSRSFSGDFFERISTGFGDCTLRRVESQREGKPKNGMHRNGEDSSSSAEDHNMNGLTPASVEHHLVHGRSKSWGRAFASPMRAFSSKQGSNEKKTAQNTKNATPNLAAIPSLLAVRS